MNRLTLADALQQDLLDSSPSALVVVSKLDLRRQVRTWKAPFRSDIDVVLFRHQRDSNKSIVTLVPRRTGSAENAYEGQQVVQWQVLDVPAENIRDLVPSKEEGPLVFRVHELDSWGRAFTRDFKSQLVVVRALEVKPDSFQSLIQKLRMNPLKTSMQSSGAVSQAVKWLLGRKWVDLVGEGGRFNALQASKEVLRERRLFVPQKTKVLHVAGEIFQGQLVIDSQSPYTGTLSPGQYFVIGRLSAAMKSLKVENKESKDEPNSLAMALLIFRSQDKPEVPGLLFVQDSLKPVTNRGLTQLELSNSPHFKFSPTSFREFLEQGVTIAGVALSSFLSPSDSSRALQASYRTALGAAGNGPRLDQGDVVVAPRFVSLQYTGKWIPGSETHIESLKAKANSGAQFVFKTSENGRHWIEHGALRNLEWMGFDSHELTFPHGLSGNIDPQTLRVSTSTAGTEGLLLPIKIEDALP